MVRSSLVESRRAASRDARTAGSPMKWAKSRKARSATVLASLWRVRNELHIGQKELARRSGVSQRMISQLERGERRAREGITQQLASALGVRPEDLMKAERRAP